MEPMEVEFDYDEYEAKMKGYDSVEEMYWNEGVEMPLKKELEFATNEDFDENQNYRCESCRNCVDSYRCKNSLELNECTDCEFCDDCVACERCTKCEDCLWCYDCYFCISCENLKNCKYCYGVKNEELEEGLSYMWEDEQLTEGEWNERYYKMMENKIHKQMLDDIEGISKLFVLQANKKEERKVVNG